MKEIYTEKAPKPIGPYSQAIVDGQYVFCSGQLGINPNLPEDPNFNRIPYSVGEQTKQIFENFKAILSAAGTSLERVVKITIYLTDERDFKEVNKIYSVYFQKNKPARSTVIVKALPVWNAKIEVDLIAKIPWKNRIFKILNIFKKQS